ncbi:hypothetical protein SK128_010362 [Halocaridina rubra]|uniref:Uncharacterized protein n=1 Tax=Halocaridina rubra TaxID=373956 RepID=A0AAN8X8Y5_HALRR
MELSEMIFFVVVGLILVGIFAVACYGVYNCVRKRVMVPRSGYVAIAEDKTSLLSRCRRGSIFNPNGSSTSRIRPVGTTARVLVDSGGFPINPPLGYYGSTCSSSSDSRHSRSRSSRCCSKHKANPSKRSSTSFEQGKTHHSSSKEVSKSHISSVATIHVSESVTRDAITPPTMGTESPRFDHAARNASSSSSEELRNSSTENSSSGCSNSYSRVRNGYHSKNESGNEKVVYIQPIPEGDISSLVQGGKGFYSGIAK